LLISGGDLPDLIRIADEQETGILRDELSSLPKPGGAAPSIDPRNEKGFAIGP
jgi:hypothetical protein